MADLVRVVSLTGFDPEGEPEIRVMADGTLCVAFNTMPPDDATPEEDELFERFDKEMAKAIGVEVMWQDRESFRVPTPTENTVDAITAFVATCRSAARQAATATEKRPARRVLLDALSDALLPIGLRKGRGDEVFVRDIAGGKQAVFVPWQSRGGEHRFSMTIAIRLEAVENLVSPCGGTDTYTTLTQLEHFGLEGEPPVGFQYVASEPGGMARALSTLRPVLVSQIVPFLERYQDVGSIDTALHGADIRLPTGAHGGTRIGLLQKLIDRVAPRSDQPVPDDPWEPWRQRRRAFDSTGEPHHTMRAIAIAHLAGNERFDDLVAQYRGSLEEMGLQPADRTRVEDFLARVTGVPPGT